MVENLLRSGDNKRMSVQELSYRASMRAILAAACMLVLLIIVLVMSKWENRAARQEEQRPVETAVKEEVRPKPLPPHVVPFPEADEQIASAEGAEASVGAKELPATVVPAEVVAVDTRPGQPRPQTVPEKETRVARNETPAAVAPAPPVNTHAKAPASASRSGEASAAASAQKKPDSSAPARPGSGASVQAKPVAPTPVAPQRVAAAPAATPTPAPVQQAEGGKKTSYRIVIGDFLEFSTSEGLRARLTRAGFPLMVQHRVAIGPYAQRSQAEAASAKLKSERQMRGMLFNAAAPEQGVMVQLGVFSASTNAQSLQHQLAASGYPVQVHQRIIAGPFAGKSAADEALVKLEQSGGAKGVIVAESGN